jgi:hypothetical protein
LFETISQILVSFNNTSLSSIAVDAVSDLVYVSLRPGYSSNYSSTSCLEQNATGSATVSSSMFPCSAIYILDGNTGHINNIIRLRPGELIHNMDINPYLRKYASGEYNYLENYTEVNGDEPIQYEDDVVYIINSTNYSSNNDTNNSSSQMTTANDIQRIRLYGEIEEGKEGDMSSIAVDTGTNTIYAGIRYFQGGREGVFIIDDNSSIIHNSNTTGMNANNGLTNTIKFIPLGDTGPDQILVNNKTNIIYSSLEYDNFIVVIDGSTKTIKEHY